MNARRSSATPALRSLLWAPLCCPRDSWEFADIGSESPPGRNDCELSRRVWIGAKSPEGNCGRELKGVNGLQRAVAQIVLAYAATGHVPTQLVVVSLAYEGVD